MSEQKPNSGSLTEEDIQQEMDKMELPSNSNSKKNEVVSPRVKQVTKGKLKKKSLSQKIGETFIAEDVANVKDYVFFDIIVPAIKDTIYNVITNGISAFMYGGRTHVPNNAPRNYGYNSQYSRSYNGQTNYSGSYQQPKRYTANRQPSSNDVFIAPSEDEARGALAELNDCLIQYGEATVGDLKSALGIVPVSTDYKWGWYDLSTVRVYRIPGYGPEESWIIDVPRPVRL